MPAPGTVRAVSLLSSRSLDPGIKFAETMETAPIDHGINCAQTQETAPMSLATSLSVTASTEDATEDDVNELIARAEEYAAQLKYIDAARCLRAISDTSRLEPRHQAYLDMAADCEALLFDLQSDCPEDEGWRKQGEAHRSFDAQIHYRVDNRNRLTTRVDFAIESSLLVPLLSVFNETELFGSWMPSWKHPQLGFRRSLKLREFDRGNQVVQVTVDMPPPLHAREGVLHAYSVDDIDTNGMIVVRSKDKKPGDLGGLVPKPEKRVVRVEEDMGIVIRSCPPDHPVLAKSRKDYPKDEKVFLVTMKDRMDPHIGFVPASFINFFTRHVIKTVVANLLQVADDVRTGKQRKHQEAIAAKADFYGWVEERCNAMSEHQMKEHLNGASY